MRSKCHGQRKFLTVQLNSRPVRRIELIRNSCTGNLTYVPFCRVLRPVFVTTILPSDRNFFVEFEAKEGRCGDTFDAYKKSYENSHNSCKKVKLFQSLFFDNQFVEQCGSGVSCHNVCIRLVHI